MKSIKLKLISLFVTLVLFVMIIAGAFVRVSVGLIEETRAHEELSFLAGFYADIIHQNGLDDSRLREFRPETTLLILYSDGTLATGAHNENYSSMFNSPAIIGAIAGNNTFIPWQETQNEQGRIIIQMQYATPVYINGVHYIIYIYSNAGRAVENLEDISRIILFSIIIATSLAIFLGYLYSTTFTKPLIELTNAAKRMAEGKLKTEAKVYNNDDEIGELAGAFNNMAKSLNRLDTMRREFVANVSHEIRTPLTVIKTYAETLKEELTESEIAQSFLTTIDLEVDRITLLATDLLELSHFDNNQMTMTMEYRDLGQILSNSIKQVSVLAEQKNQKITSLIKEDMVCYVDSIRINQVFVNILSNAVKYSDENTNIKVATKVTKEKFIVTIKDEGIGISEEDLSHIFERFYRVDKARSRESGGSGLGLSIVKEILDMHSASVFVKSGKGIGTIFEISFNKENI
ncbi:MAG: cell wall metabolism sensor histidine kinase WalK [Defluviitaleaceae bacterium]|nr:cell wall metabolism sensor histidine kinase WalK [Defluviitaleaceae bacterium]